MGDWTGKQQLKEWEAEPGWWLGPSQLQAPGAGQGEGGARSLSPITAVFAPPRGGRWRDEEVPCLSDSDTPQPTGLASSPIILSRVPWLRSWGKGRRQHWPSSGMHLQVLKAPRLNLVQWLPQTHRSIQND